MIETYAVYRLSARELALVVLRQLIMSVAIGLLFFDSLLGSVACMLAMPVAITGEKRKRIEARRERLQEEFRDGLYALSAALEAGYSLENAMAEAYRDLILLHGEKGLLVLEFRYMLRQMQLGKSVGEVFAELGKRSGLEDISRFSELLTTAKRAGGNLLSITRTCGQTLQQKTAVRREIATIVAAKQYEVRVMKLIPYGVLLYLRLFGAEFIQPLYNGWTGAAIMLGLLLCHLAAGRLAERIVRIAV